MSDTTPVCENLASTGSHGHGLGPVPQDSGAAYQAGYDAGVLHGKEVGYRQGYRDAFSDSSHQAKGVTAAAARTEEHTGRRLLGLPCDSCGCCFYSDETRCPRCKSSRSQPTAETVAASSI